MKSLLNTFTFFCIFAFIAISAFAQTLPPQVVDADLNVLIEQALSLINQREVLGSFGLAVGITILLLNVINSKLLGNFFSKRDPIVKRALVVLFAEAVTIMLSIYGGVSVTTALIGGLFVSGGAIAIYEVIKPLVAYFKNK